MSQVKIEEDKEVRPSVDTHVGKACRSFKQGRDYCLGYVNQLVCDKALEVWKMVFYKGREEFRHRETQNTDLICDVLVCPFLQQMRTWNRRVGKPTRMHQYLGP